MVCCALAWDVLKDGLVQLTNFTPGSSTLALFAAAFTLADGVTMVLTPLRESAVPFFAPCALVLLFQLIGQYCDRASKFQACRTASSVARPYVVTQDPDVLAGKTGFRKWLGLPKGFGSQIRTTSQADERFQKLTPVLMTACVCLALLTTVAHHQPKLVLWSLSALFTASATLGASLTLSFPLQILGSKLATLGVALAGWPGIAAAKGCRAALLTDNDLYPPGTVTLANSKPLSNLPMDRVVAYTASAIRASGSGLSYLFDKLLRSEGAKYLPIEKILLQDNGLIAQTQGQQILVGNSDFMSKQGIALPTGIKYKNTVFCAVDRELIGMFGVRYALHTTIVPSLQSLLGHRIAPVLVTRDFNINPKRMRFSDRLNKDSLTYPGLTAPGDPLRSQPGPRPDHRGRPLPGGHGPLHPGPHRRQAGAPGRGAEQLFRAVERLRGCDLNGNALQRGSAGRHVRVAHGPLPAAVVRAGALAVPLDRAILNKHNCSLKRTCCA